MEEMTLEELRKMIEIGEAKIKIKVDGIDCSVEIEGNTVGIFMANEKMIEGTYKALKQKGMNKKLIKNSLEYFFKYAMEEIDE